ncbi:MAG: hypothetical protein Q4F17_04665 [Eubacteriales bacterium]|nr:hypothetical protein [Eubacteriales bacterium]
MKRGWYLPFALEALAAALVFWKFPGDGTLFGAMALPFTLLGKGLRQLSLSGAAGNLAAWAVYLALSLAPLGVLAWRAARKQASREDWLLAVLAGVVAWGLYCLVNPGSLPGIWGGTDVGAYLCAQVIWSAVLCCALFLALRVRPERLLGWLLNGLGAVVVLNAWGVELGRLVLKMDQVRQANTLGSLALTNGILLLRYGMDLVNGSLGLWVIGAGRTLADRLSRDAYAQDTVDAAQVLIRRGTVALKTAAAGTLGLNLIQVLAGERLRDMALNVDLPLLSMVLLLAGILLGRLLTRGKALQDDSDLII